MFAIIGHILVTAALLFIVGRIISGIEVRDAKAAIIGAVVLGLANFFVRPLLVLLTLPLTILTLGLFLIVVNAIVLMVAAAVVDGFAVKNFRSALLGSLLLTVLNLVVSRLLG